jgi:predicted nucleic acid-binding protein
MALNRVLDTNAILYLLGGKLLHPIPQGRYFISIITEMELLSYPSISEVEQSQIQSFLSRATIVGLTKFVKERAIVLRRQYRLKLADAIVAATALSLEPLYDK